MELLKNARKDYAIHHETHIIQTIYHNKQYYSLIYERDQQLYVSVKPLKLIDRACRAMGSNFEASSKAARDLLNNKLKAPIIVGLEQHNPYIMFPLYSPKSPQNIWVSYNNITNIANYKHKITITFKQHIEIDLPVLISSFNNQYVSAAMLFKATQHNWKRFNNAL